MHAKTPVEKAAEAVGGASRLAALLGVTAQAVSNWKDGGIPLERCVAVERLTGVSRRELRPDDWFDIWPELADAKQRGGGKGSKTKESKAA